MRLRQVAGRALAITADYVLSCTSSYSSSTRSTFGCRDGSTDRGDLFPRRGVGMTNSVVAGARLMTEAKKTDGRNMRRRIGGPAEIRSCLGCVVMLIGHGLSESAVVVGAEPEQVELALAPCSAPFPCESGGGRPMWCPSGACLLLGGHRE